MCVPRFDVSLNSAIRITYRISLRCSSLREPRHPPYKVMCLFYMFCVVSSQATRLVFCGLCKLERPEPMFNRARGCVWFPGRGAVVAYALTQTPGRYLVMILPQVHLRQPCYDFTFL